MKKIKFNGSEYLRAIKGITKISEIVDAICGNKIGGGCYRDVYEYRFNEHFVVKIERDPSRGAFANVTEWRNYIDNMHFDKIEQWLAPCEMINETGQILIQRRIYQNRPHSDFHKKIPAIFCDQKYQNFGWIGDRFVCCDYSFFLGLQSVRLKNAKWWDNKKATKKQRAKRNEQAI